MPQKQQGNSPRKGKEEDGKDVHMTHYGPARTNKDDIQVQFTVAQPKKATSRSDTEAGPSSAQPDNRPGHAQGAVGGRPFVPETHRALPQPNFRTPLRNNVTGSRMSTSAGMQPALEAGAIGQGQGDGRQSGVTMPSAPEMDTGRRQSLEGDPYKSHKASEFMPSLPIPGVKYPHSPRNETSRRNSDNGGLSSSPFPSSISAPPQSKASPSKFKKMSTDDRRQSGGNMQDDGQQRGPPLSALRDEPKLRSVPGDTAASSMPTGSRNPALETNALPGPKVNRKSIDGRVQTRGNLQEQEGPRMRTTHYGANRTNAPGVQVQIMVAQPRKSAGEPPPQTQPSPPEAVQPAEVAPPKQSHKQQKQPWEDAKVSPRVMPPSENAKGKGDGNVDAGELLKKPGTPDLTKGFPDKDTGPRQSGDHDRSRQAPEIQSPYDTATPAVPVDPTAPQMPIDPTPPAPKVHRVSIDGRVQTRAKIQEQDGPQLVTTHYGANRTNVPGIKVEIIVAKPRKKPEPPKPPEEVAPPKQLIQDYVSVVTGMRPLEEEKESESNVPSPEYTDDGNVDAIQLLKKFGIPDQTKALQSLLDKDTVHYDFGGLMRQYYSYVLRSYCLINMQDRYRGVPRSANCFTAVDISKIGTRDEEMEKHTKARLKKLDDTREALRRVAVDEDHFNYLKNLAHSQASLLPLTIVHTMNENMAPVLEDIFRFYGKNLGTEHKCTKVAGFHYMKMRKRVAMYNYICGGSTLEEDLSAYYK